MNPLLFPPSRLARSVLHSESDERLAELARAGSGPAFEAIVARHRRSLVRLCARIVGETDAEEAVQNAMLSAHLALVRGYRVENLGAWLRAISHNASLNILRARAARPECSDEGRQLAEAHDDPAGRREQLGELVEAVQSLPLRQRHAIVMRELEGRSYDEIAVRLGATNGAVRQLLNRARAAVRDRLAVLPGLEPLARWLGGGSNGAASARLGALASGCTLSAKLCAAALVPAVIAGGSGGVTLPAAARHRATVALETAPRPTAATTASATAHAAHILAARQLTPSVPAPREKKATVVFDTPAASKPRTRTPRLQPRTAPAPHDHDSKPPADPQPSAPQHRGDQRRPANPQPPEQAGPPERARPAEQAGTAEQPSSHKLPYSTRLPPPPPSGERSSPK